MSTEKYIICFKSVFVFKHPTFKAFQKSFKILILFYFVSACIDVKSKMWSNFYGHTELQVETHFKMDDRKSPTQPNR